MGKKDDYQYNYLDNYERFADQVNGALFGGRQVVKAEELEPADARSVYLGKEAGVRKDLDNGSDEFLSQMKKDEKFTPIITLVVYCGTDHPWDGARCLYDLLEIDDEMKEFVTNYKVNLYDCHEHDTFDEYHTGLQQLFEVIRYGNDKEQLQKVMEKNKEAYINIDSETREMIEVMTGLKHLGQHKTMENGKERYNMLKAFEDMIEDGRREGRVGDILELLGELGQVPKRVMELIKAEDNPDILSKWLKSAAKATSIAEFEANM